MMYREVKYLANSYELKELISKYKLKLKVVDNQQIFIISKCFVIEIYGLIPETIFYFDLYSIDLKLYSSIDRILSDHDSGKISSIYQQQINKMKGVLIHKLQGNEENTLKAERCFFTYVQLMDDILSDLLFCKRNIYLHHFTETFEYKYKELISVLQIGGEDIHR
ncbi:MAG: hypothetical protein ABI315_16290 [Bacteroidia bacterium]